MSRLVLTLLAATALLGGCVERRTVYRDDASPRYGVYADDDRWRRGSAVCDAGDQVCYRKGRPNREATRDVFGKRATRGW
jgi:hypothetical protein